MLRTRWGCGRALPDAALDAGEGARGEDALSREVAYSCCAKLWRPGCEADGSRGAGARWGAMLYGGTAGCIRPMDASILMELEAAGAFRTAGCTRDDLGGLPSCT